MCYGQHWKCLTAKIGMVRAEIDGLLQSSLEQFKRLLPPAFHYFSWTGSYCISIWNDVKGCLSIPSSFSRQVKQSCWNPLQRAFTAGQGHCSGNIQRSSAPWVVLLLKPLQPLPQRLCPYPSMDMDTDRLFRMTKNKVVLTNTHLYPSNVNKSCFNLGATTFTLL